MLHESSQRLTTLTFTDLVRIDHDVACAITDFTTAETGEDVIHDFLAFLSGFHGAGIVLGIFLEDVRETGGEFTENHQTSSLSLSEHQTFILSMTSDSFTAIPAPSWQ